MADFEDALNSILSDPDAMGQIMALAGKLGGPSSPPPPEPSPELPEPASQPQPPPVSPSEAPPELEQLMQLGPVLKLLQNSSTQAPPESAALLTALRPFLRPAQQGKLDRALRLAGLSKTARQVYQLWKEGQLHV